MVRCNKTTVNGKKCKRSASPGRKACWQHGSKKRSPQRRSPQRKHRRSRSPRKVYIKKIYINKPRHSRRHHIPQYIRIKSRKPSESTKESVRRELRAFRPDFRIKAAGDLFKKRGYFIV